MIRCFLFFAGFHGFISVMAGAFGAHVLQKFFQQEAADPVKAMNAFEVGARYQMYHALALIGAAYAVDKIGGKLPTVSGWCFVVGAALFSTVLYLYAVTGIGVFGALAPVGGTLQLVGWACLMAAAARWHPSKRRAAQAVAA